MGEFKDAENQRFFSPSQQRPSCSQSDTSSDSGLSSVESVPQTEDTVYSPGRAHGVEGTHQETSYRDDIEDGDANPDEPFLHPSKDRASGNRTRRIFWVLGLLCVGGWLFALVLFLVQRRSTGGTSSTVSVHGPDSETWAGSNGKPVTLEQLLSGQWYPRSHGISWIPGPNDEDGLLLEVGKHEGEKGYLRVQDVRSRKGGPELLESKVLMNDSRVQVDEKVVFPAIAYPSKDLKMVLLVSDLFKNWRHSTVGSYWLFDVETQTAQPLDPTNPDKKMQLAHWSPTSDAVVFVRDNNIYLRKLASNKVIPITKDGGKELFYGVPDWVYEEEVFEGNSATWWSGDGKYIAFLRTNESMVPEYPIQYFLSRPSGKRPPPGLENYPEVRQIKYPKAGAPNPVVDLQVYDVDKDEVFSVDSSDDFHDDNRIIFEVIWASNGRVLVKETNRESDILKVFLVDTKNRTAKLVRQNDIAGLDGGWVESTQSTQFIPADGSKGRPHDGYIDTVIHEGFEHLGYFSPLDNPDPIMLTSGQWQVDSAPSAVDLQRGLVYFIGTKESPTERHVYRVKLDGSDFQTLTNTSAPGYYGTSFSHGTGYALLSYSGPEIPWQALINTQGDDVKYEQIIEENKELSRLTEEYALPSKVYQNVTVDGYTLQVVERRPPHFNPAKKYPVLFYLYGGPGSQSVDRSFGVDFQSYVASNLSYIVVTVDGRGTGYIGRKAKCITRDKLGYYESRDQIETAKIWGKKEYVDETRIAIWGWSYGGFMTLKTLDQDGGRTFQYGMAVAPVTDWRLYDSIYTERYMHTPQHNPSGYSNHSVVNVSSLAQSERFLIMHGVSDDNVHLQNTLVLIDQLDLSDITNYDIQVFPDSDHSIFFHNGYRVVYERLSTWLVNAFNGEWKRIANPVPKESLSGRLRRSISSLMFDD